MQNNPLLLLLMIGVSLYVIKLWWTDRRAAKDGPADPRSLPGATRAPLRALIIAAIGALLILGGETWGELRLGLSEKQTNITGLFAAYTLCAAFVEEIVFRGFIVVENRGSALRWLGVFLASILFAALHPFLWDWQNGALQVTFTAKGVFSTLTVFVSSLWFYTVRFAKFNPQQSLSPCFAAHFSKNLGVIVIKLAQGHFAGWF